MDKLAKGINYLIVRWTRKQPKLARHITDVSLGVGITMSVVPLFLNDSPNWVAAVSALLVSVGSKFLVEDKQ